MKTQKKITLAVLAAVCTLQMNGAARAEEASRPTANLSVSALSKYVWRGFEYSRDSIVVQPSMTVAYKGVSANVWGNIDTDQYSSDPAGDTTNAWSETDFTLAYDWTMEPVALTAGYIYYGLDGMPDTQEVFVRAAFHTLLTPTLAIYRDYDNTSGWYATLGVSHTLPLSEGIGLTLGGQVGYVSAEDADDLEEVDASFAGTGSAYRGFHDGLLSASVTIPLSEYLSVTPALNYSFPLTSKASDLIEARSLRGGGSGDNDYLYGGVTVSLAF